MSATIAYGATTITLSPVNSPKKSEVNLQVQRDTIGGQRRVSLVWRKYSYEMMLEPLTTAAYDAIRDLWVAARAAGSFLTFAYPEWWPETTGGVLVDMTLGPQENPYGAYCSATLAMTEASPR